MKAHFDIPQHVKNEYEEWVPNQAWFNLRHAKITATGLDKLLGGKVVSDRYQKGVAWSILRIPTDAELDSYLSKDMKRGNDLEPFAIEALKNSYDIPEQRECAFIDITDTFGFSPDFVNTELTFGAEIKCFQSESMAEVVFDGVPKKNFKQLMSYFLIPTMKEVWFVVFCPAYEMVSGQDYLHIEVLKREDYLDEISEIYNAILQADKNIKNLRSRL